MLLLLLPALAQETAPAPTEPTVAPKAREFLMEMNFRGRYMFFPSGILDIWYEDHEGDPLVPERPSVNAYALGLEFVVKGDSANGIFYLEYINPLIEDGYWDDREDPPDDTDGSWIAPDKFGLVALGADYAYELKATPWLSFLFGAGAGVGIKTGDLVTWDPGEPEGTVNGDNVEPDCGPTKPAYERKEECTADGVIGMPGAVPILDVNIGFRFNFSDRAALRIEGGLHDLPYTGASLGVVF